jgi:hypothetical protein
MERERERWRERGDDVMPNLSQGHPCPQLFAKRHQTPIAKDVCKDLLAGREEEEKRSREIEGERE